MGGINGIYSSDKSVTVMVEWMNDYALQVYSDSPPATLQPVYDEISDEAVDEHDMVGGAVHQLHTYVLEWLAWWCRVRNEYGESKLDAAILVSKLGL